MKRCNIMKIEAKQKKEWKYERNKKQIVNRKSEYLFL